MPNNQGMIIGGFTAAAVLIYAAISDSTIWEVLTGGTKPIDDSGSDSGATDGTQSTVPSSAGGDTALRAAVVDAAVAALSITSGYSNVRPIPSSLQAAESTPTDCSGFVTLCYKEAGAPDPNGLGYSGYGYTGTLIEHGRKTSSPTGGDLHFWSNPGHVAIDVGDGQVIGWGEAPGPRETTIQGQSIPSQRYLGARSYLPTKETK
jgi:cell wall-associated NlpC family hydrolase